MEEEDPDKLKPYKTDLEYLDDHFQLINFKIRVKSMDQRMELEVSQLRYCNYRGASLDGPSQK